MFRHVMFVSRGVDDDVEALKQALSLARNDKAQLSALILCPELPAHLSDYREQFEASLRGALEAQIASARAAIGASDADMQVSMALESGASPALRCVRHAIRNAVDLVVKAAEPKEGGLGFRAIDMELLRKCPCPVWLARPIARHRDQIKVAAAIDPEKTAPEGRALSIRLLQLGQGLALNTNKTLDVVSCWDFDFERHMHRGPWIKIDKQEVLDLAQRWRDAHGAALEAVMNEAGGQEGARVHRLQGAPEDVIPAFLDEQEIDVLVMGTVARTGVAGLMIGNTAENILQKVGCSLLALKPLGFVSPVSAYD